MILHDASVSRLHANLIFRSDGSIEFEDASSTNGSFLFERGELVRISSKYLEPDACLQFGKERVSLAEIVNSIHLKIRGEGAVNA